MSKHRFIRMEEIVHIAKEMGIVADAGYVEMEIDVNDIVSFAKRIETVARADERKDIDRLLDLLERAGSCLHSCGLRDEVYAALGEARGEP